MFCATTNKPRSRTIDPSVQFNDGDVATCSDSARACFPYSRSDGRSFLSLTLCRSRSLLAFSLCLPVCPLFSRRIGLDAVLICWFFKILMQSLVIELRLFFSCSSGEIHRGSEVVFSMNAMWELSWRCHTELTTRLERNKPFFCRLSDSKMTGG